MQNVNRLKAAGASVTSVVAKASGGTLYRVTIWNGNAAIRYAHIFDAASLPANGTAPTEPPHTLAVTGASVDPVVIDFGPDGVFFPTGIVVANSTTQTTLTIGSADSIIMVIYR